MITEKEIQRINELARKSKAEGLTAAEKEEQTMLRQQFIASVKANIRSQMDNIDVIQPDGHIENMGDRIRKKEAEQKKKLS